MGTFLELLKPYSTSSGSQKLAGIAFKPFAHPGIKREDRFEDDAVLLIINPFYSNFLSPEYSRAAASHRYDHPSLLTHPTPPVYAVQPRF
jgi:hypothetical protein